MTFNINIPVKIISGKDCLKQNSALLSIGKRAIIVCGGHGAAASGALGDACEILAQSGIEYLIFDKITENPPLATCYDGGMSAAAFGADFVIGIGGGSSLDAAKAIAAFASNPDIAPLDIFDDKKLVNRALPLVLIPTTAGTGSEANPYSIITLPDGKQKKTFNHPDSWARVAFLDPNYTMSLPHRNTISCALDAFAHGLESYLSPKATDISSMFAMYAMRGIWDVLTSYPENFTYEMRETLLYASCAAGLAISITGTGFPHPLGYSLTLLDGIPHGAACAVFDGDYIEYNERTELGKAKMSEIYAALHTTPRIMKEYLPALAEVELSMTAQEIEQHIELVAGAKNYANSPYVITKEEMFEIYNKHFAKSARKGRK
ncbi:MAG: iron-containing alcohol dehydrogenase [Clostridia bacterium]|nr:iron-containing alcohol dehydrogenase [Clostridia bacterium]